MNMIWLIFQSALILNAGVHAGTDILVVHNAIPEEARGVSRYLHMPPSVIGTIASQAKVKKLILSHRMLRVLGREDETGRFIRKLSGVAAVCR